MFYQTKDNNHGLPHDPLKSCIVPRPIGWITTLRRDGVVNLAPYSFFTEVTFIDPWYVFLPVRFLPAKETTGHCARQRFR